jgi:hypothetical protein
VLSYYEFKRPRAQALTVEAWRRMLAGPEPPTRPPWTGGYLTDSRRQRP